MSTVLVAVVFVVILGSFVQGVMGFGSGMTCMALLPFFMPMSDVISVIAVVCLFINIRLLAQLWPSIRWRSLLFLGIGAMGGVPLGVYVLKILDEGQLKIGLGLLMLLYTVVKLSPLGLLGRTLPDRWGLLFGSIGGAFGASSNVGGPPLIIYATMKGWGKDETKATLQAYFLVISLIQVPAFMMTGLLRGEHVLPIVLGIPALLVGAWAGSRVSQGIDGGMFARLMVWAVAVMGIYYLVQGLLS
jgi:uncharacterized membrane protein YfcA